MFALLLSCFLTISSISSNDVLEFVEDYTISNIIESHDDVSFNDVSFNDYYDFSDENILFSSNADINDSEILNTINENLVSKLDGIIHLLQLNFSMLIVLFIYPRITNAIKKLMHPYRR